MAEPLLQLEGLGLRLGQRKRLIGKDEKGFPILSDITFSVAQGEILALVGESGSGKTTLGRAIAGLTMIQKGALTFQGVPILREGEGAWLGMAQRRWYAKWRDHRQAIQMIFQDPMSSLNPRRTIGQSLQAPLRSFGIRDVTPEALLTQVGLPEHFVDQYPHRLSGGQRQRVGIARALAGRPKLIIADEVVSGLDVSSQARILTLLQDLRATYGLSILFITHDLAVVRVLADRVLVMERGKIREDGPVAETFANPKHSYTTKLLRAVPTLDYDPTWLDKTAKGAFSMKIENAVALVTGANRGIGAGFVQALLDRGAARVYAAARDTSALPQDPRIVPLALDITDPSQVAAAVAQAPDVTLLINNAGFNANKGAIKNAALDDARREMEVNYFGTLSMIRAFAPVLKSNGGGAIVNMLSILSRVALPMMGTLCASKAAGLSMTQSVRAELAAQGTRVFAVMPGAVDTDMSRDFPPPKLDPADVVRAALNGLESGDEEDIYPGDMAQGLRAGLEHDPKEVERDLAGYLP